MGKSLDHEGSHSSPEGHGAGRMKGILQHFHHNPWNKVKKKIPHKKHGSTRHSTEKESSKTTAEKERSKATAEKERSKASEEKERSKATGEKESSKTTTEAAEIQKNSDSVIDNSPISGAIVKKTPHHLKGMESGRSHKGWMKFRLKALLIDEMSRKKGHHRRTTSCPADNEQLETPIPVHNSVSSDTEPHAESNNSGEVLKGHDRVHPAALLDPVLPKIGQDSCKSCTSESSMNYLKQSEVEKIVHQPVRDHTLLQHDSIYAIEPSKDASIQESKLFMDALDLLNMRKEVFQKIVQDQSSSLADQLHTRRKSNLQSSLTKSVSFPAPGPSARLTHAHDNYINSQENGPYNKKEDGLQHSVEDNKQLAIAKGSHMENVAPSTGIKSSDYDSSYPSIMLRKTHNNKVALNHFKKLRAKLKVVIRGKKPEKDHIVRDAVHHKVPYGQKASEDLYDDHHMNPESRAKYGSRIGEQGSKFGKSPQKSFNRAVSFNESVDRYNWLLETCSNRQTREGTSRKDFITSSEDNTFSSVPKRRPATLSRILSLPELRTYPSMRIEDSVTINSVHKPDMGPVGNTCAESVDPNEQKPLNIGSENEFQPSAFLESESEQDMSDFFRTSYESVNSMAWESASSHASNFEPVLSSPRQPSEQHRVSQNDLNYEEGELSQGLAAPASEDLEEDSSPILQENSVNVDTLESKIKQYYDDHLHVEVDAKNESEFTYVKEVLELSGFSRDEILGKWYSAEYPVDPTVFDEVEGCWLAQPEWSGYEESEICDRLLLFDLINEVLLGIYERSHCYWPMPLTSQSYIHQMPKGRRVLEEVWADIRWLLCSSTDIDQSVEDIVTRDFAKRDGWMNLQFNTECVGLEVEDLIFGDLLEEIFSS